MEINEIEIAKQINNLGYTDEEANNFNRQRIQANKEILNIIQEYINKNTKQRFIQVLWNLDIINNQDRFNEEPQVTLKRIKTRLEQIDKIKENLH